MDLQRQRKRALGIMTAATMGTALLTGFATTVRADEDGQEAQLPAGVRNVRLDMELTDAPITVAVRLIHEKTGLDIVFVNSDQDFKPVTVSLKNKPATQALKLIANSSGADIWTENGVYFIGPKGSAPKQDTVQPVNTVSRPKQPLTTEKIYLRHAEPSYVLTMLGVKNAGPLADFQTQQVQKILDAVLKKKTNPYEAAANANSTLFREPYTGDVQHVFVAPSVPTNRTTGTTSSTGTTGTTNVTNDAASTAGTLANQLGSQLLRSVTGDQTAHRSDSGAHDEFNRAPQPPGGGFPGGSGFPGGGGFPGQGGTGTGGTGTGGTGTNGQTRNGQTANARELLPTDISEIVAYESDNSIIVRGTPEAINELRQLIRFFDVAPKQVIVKAEFITVQQNDTSGFGINWNLQKVNLQAGVNTGFSTTNTAFLTFATGNLQAQLSFILNTSRGKIVAAPSISTMNNLPISLDVSTTIPVFIQTPVVSPTGTVAQSTSIIPIPVQTTLLILPRINADNTISLFGEVSIQGTGTPVVGPDGSSYPVVTSQDVTIQRRIRSGDTMVIGGLTSKNDTVTEERVPILSDLPLIGNLFRGKQVTTNDSELLVFVTPTIIPDRNDAGAISGGGTGSPAGSDTGGNPGPPAGPGGNPNP